MRLEEEKGARRLGDREGSPGGCKVRRSLSSWMRKEKHERGHERRGRLSEGECKPSKTRSDEWAKREGLPARRRGGSGPSNYVEKPPASGAERAPRETLSAGPPLWQGQAGKMASDTASKPRRGLQLEDASISSLLWRVPDSAYGQKRPLSKAWSLRS